MEDKKRINKAEFSTPDDFFREVRRILAEDRAELKEGATEEVIRIFEEKWEVKLSNELTSYFKIVNGVDNAEWISSIIPLMNLEPVSEYCWFKGDEGYKSAKYHHIFILGNIMIDSHQWAIELNPTGEPERIIEMDLETTLATSISEFLELFVNETPYSLVGGEVERKHFIQNLSKSFRRGAVI